MRLPVLALVALVLVVPSCAYQRHFVPDPPKTGYRLPLWPRGSVAVQVEDRRAQPSDDSLPLKEVIRLIVDDALRTAQGAPGPPSELRIVILDHEAQLVASSWTAKTRLQATLRQGDRLIGQWDAVGEEKKWNMLPAYIDAESASQTAFDRAVAKLMAGLEQGPSR